MVSRISILIGLGFLASALPAAAQTLDQSLAAAYANNPTLQSERANLRATDEGVPAALAGWRPTVTLQGTAGYIQGNVVAGGGGALGSTGSTSTITENRDTASVAATISENVYNGGGTKAAVAQAKNKVMAERANLINIEQQVFANVVQSYVTVIENQQLLALAINNAQVLKEQLKATQDRFSVGEITRTDVAQSESALAQAEAEVQTARGNLQTSRAQFRAVIGLEPARLTPPQPMALPVQNKRQVSDYAGSNNPQVVQALFTQAASSDGVNVAWAKLMPQLSIQGQLYKQINQAESDYVSNGAEILAQLTVPIYQGGSEYAAIRQAVQEREYSRQQVELQRRTAIQNAEQYWETLVATRATITSTRAEIAANEIALDGTEREAIVGSRTTLDVLNAQQLLLQSQVTLVQNLANLVIASYNVAEAMGRLTARDIGLRVPLYDDNSYYRAVKNAWIGTGDPTANTFGDTNGSPSDNLSNNNQ
ncbi:TolC family outer membrane protein [Acidisoma cellulosilytica]|uniref:TolC family outer membrane protein n=1 Tax=Acidisoma cellulosilyticum TaxID=2802395 RepID=A0A963YZ01_9PROT|nr:TolC family outer membrane protein [Acidisoma cellulosilyticum]MCB8879655.1 TolC family outer membrane protein [Acidisoma cellulosilyticum]